MANCLECGKQLYGRKDKRFCNACCRNAYHRRIRNGSRLVHYRIIHILEQNYRILDSLLKSGITTIDRAELALAGFRSAYITGYAQGRHRHTEHQCFDIRYLITDSKVFGIRKMLDTG